MTTRRINVTGVVGAALLEALTKASAAAQEEPKPPHGWRSDCTCRSCAFLKRDLPRYEGSARIRLARAQAEWAEALAALAQARLAWQLAWEDVEREEGTDEHSNEKEPGWQGRAPRRQ